MAASASTVTSALQAIETSNVAVVLNRKRAKDAATASSRKHSAVSGAIRPGFDVPTVPAGSGNSHWSKPGFQLIKYSASVSRPIKPVNQRQPPARRSRWVWSRAPNHVAGSSASCSAMPIRMKASAVFGFIDTQVGRMLFKAGISSAQPIRTATPVTSDATLAADTNAACIIDGRPLRAVVMAFRADLSAPRRRSSRRTALPARAVATMHLPAV